MKKVIYIILSITMLTACKKESSNSNTTTINQVACIDNPNINFTSIGTPIGKLGDCIKDVDGNTYKTVTIGTQTWMAENLKTSKYSDRTAIPNVKDDSEWSNLTKGAWAYYSNDPTNNAKYGKLYNWYSISPITNGNKNICPSGWHIPNDNEWTVLADYLGGSNISGDKLKEVGTTSWNNLNEYSTNTSLFTGLPGGRRYDLGDYYNIGNEAYWWSSSEDETDYAWSHGLDDDPGNTYKSDYNKKNGFSIRCIKD
jgi:uncharacterized protein (TIGR02145 family)